MKYKFDCRCKFILRFLECKIYFAVFGVQNLFCGFWSAKFILRQIVFFGNAAFAYQLDISLLYSIGKRYIVKSTTHFGAKRILGFSQL